MLRVKRAIFKRNLTLSPIVFKIGVRLSDLPKIFVMKHSFYSFHSPFNHAQDSPRLYTLQSTPYTLHSTPYTLHSPPYVFLVVTSGMG